MWRRVPRLTSTTTLPSRAAETPTRPLPRPTSPQGGFLPTSWKLLLVTLILSTWISPAAAQVAVQGDTVYTMAGPPIENGLVLVRDGKIAAVGRADAIAVPDEFETLQAAVVTPGLIDARSTVGLSGIFNYDHDQDQLERSEPIQPELRAVDAYNAQEELIAWVRSFGVTTVHTGHAPGELMSGQTIIVKTWGPTAEAATLVEARAVAATLSRKAQKRDGKSPGTRGKMMAMLRTQFIQALEYRAKQQAAEQDEEKDAPDRNLRLETLVKVLDGEMPLLITAHRAQDIASSLRLAREFEIDIWLDGAAEAYLLIDEIKAAEVPVFVHPVMARPMGDLENLSFETPAKLHQAGIPIAFQSGFESYVPKTRVVLFEAALAAAHGLSFEDALAAITSQSASILAIDDRVGTLEVGKDGDLALFDGDPFEYTSHCVGVVINGQIVNREIR